MGDRSITDWERHYDECDKILRDLGIEDPICGFDCPPGWVDLVRRCLADMVQLGWTKQLTQVKSKFGGLRVYIDDGSPAIDTRIAIAEQEAYKTCEICGAPALTYDDRGWIRTECNSCKNNS